MRLLRSLHTGTTASVVSGGGASEPFPIEVGVKQDCVLTPVLFNFYVVAVTLLNRNAEGGGLNPIYKFEGGFPTVAD